MNVLILTFSSLQDLEYDTFFIPKDISFSLLEAFLHSRGFGVLGFWGFGVGGWVWFWGLGRLTVA